ncbi:MAG TPA: hypothetical protein VGZ28_08350, partial [Terriglobales bacterium]|nr:hypothetical protein [Terriglobales bacterium]
CTLAPLPKVWFLRRARSFPIPGPARSRFLFLPYVLYRVMLASFGGDVGAAVLAGNVFVRAFDLHRPVAEDPVRGRDFPVRQPALDQGV